MTSLSTKLAERQASNCPIRVGLIGAGKFGSMFIAQSARTIGIHLTVVADLDPARAIAALGKVHFPSDKYDVELGRQISIEQAIETGRTTVTADAEYLIRNVDVRILLRLTRECKQ